MAEQEKQTSEELMHALESELKTYVAETAQPPLDVYDFLTLILFVALCAMYVCFKKGMSFKDVLNGARFIKEDLVNRYNSLRDSNGRITVKSIANNLAEAKNKLSAEYAGEEITAEHLTNKFLTTFKIPKWYFWIFLVSVVVCLYFLLADVLRF